MDVTAIAAPLAERLQYEAVSAEEYLRGTGQSREMVNRGRHFFVARMTSGRWDR